MADITPEILSKSDFARRQGWKPSYVTKLAQQGRLVLVGEGRSARVDVAASLAKIEDTADHRYDVHCERHAKRRAGGTAKASTAADPPGSDDETPAPTNPSGAAESAASIERRAKATKMHYEARRAVVRVARLQGRLTDLAIVTQFAGNDGATLRSLLENLADQAAPRLAPVSDPQVCARILGELFGDIENTLEQLAAKNRAAMRQAAAEGLS